MGPPNVQNKLFVGQSFQPTISGQSFLYICFLLHYLKIDVRIKRVILISMFARTSLFLSEFTLFFRLTIFHSCFNLPNFVFFEVQLLLSCINTF